MNTILMSNGKNIINTDDFTIKLYLECYSSNSITIEEAKIMNDLFYKLKNHELEDAQYTDENGFIQNAIKIIKKDKNFKAINIEEINSDIDENANKKDIYFIKSLSTLLSVMPYISPNDRACLNSIFDGMIEFKQGISEIKKVNDELYLPRYNYKEKTMK
ncbi:MAG: hypothetical protein NC181_04250 [Clostridium sp.]|nr:hypothetical protein [Clostridium sp.]MCM1444443.1 hypothetical protein [Candidatus Amulumruptor caecigallinarius]